MNHHLFERNYIGDENEREKETVISMQYVQVAVFPWPSYRIRTSLHPTSARTVPPLKRFELGIDNT